VISEPADKAAEAGSFPGPIRRQGDPDLAASLEGASMTKKFLATATHLTTWSERCRDESNKVLRSVSRSTDPNGWAWSFLATSLSRKGDFVGFAASTRSLYTCERHGMRQAERSGHEGNCCLLHDWTIPNSPRY
jgi:hypothetical protein